MISLVGAMGAFHGAILSRTGARRDRSRQGNQLVGGGLLGAGRAHHRRGLCQQAPVRPSRHRRVGDGLGRCQQLRRGLGLLISDPGDDDDRLAFGLMEGFGIAGTLWMAGTGAAHRVQRRGLVLGVLATGKESGRASARHACSRRTSRGGWPAAFW